MTDNEKKQVLSEEEAAQDAAALPDDALDEAAGGRFDLKYDRYGFPVKGG